MNTSEIQDLGDGSAMAPILMHADELSFLEKHIRSTTLIFEWGSGYSTPYLASKVKHVTSVEHDKTWIAKILPFLPRNVTLVLAQPGGAWAPPDDGTAETFAGYVNAYRGDCDVVIIDGRARVACAKLLAGFAGLPPRAIFLHDCQRSEYQEIWLTLLKPVARVRNMMMLQVRE